MATKTPRPPDDSTDAVHAAARDLMPSRFPRQAHAELPVHVSPALAVRHLGLDAVLDGAGLDSATLVGWRHVVRLGDEPVALADVDDSGGGAQVRQLNYGPYVGSVAKAAERSVRAVEKHGGVASLLQIPALYILALWHDRGDDGTVTVLDPAPAPFEPGVAYDADEFVALLREAARAVGPDGSALPEPQDDEKEPPPRARAR